ncbi:PTS transporter subunit EIIC [Piscicoccus intestinalis]|uniref:PTS transporter subunit EIIC n=1 Tax=Piscicoccus intestinalis TaxID=746033 RepID=UPI000838758F|nr:PTS transporter subunit EIIC [Piscicoccus intestinalis]
MTIADETSGRRRMNLAGLQKFGRSLMLPIAALPVAGLMLRLGSDDMLGADGLNWGPVAAVIGAGGSALFDNLPLLFALGVAIGMARRSDGSTALAAVVGYLTYKSVGDAMSPYILGPAAEGEKQELINFGVLGGILVGLIAAFLWQRYHRIKLPDYLAFFGGRRFVPIITAFAALALSVVMSFIYPAFDTGLTGVGEWVSQNTVIGGFVYGTLNRLLIPLGLHHILNSVPWFVLGSFQPAGGEVVHGDIARFLSGDPTAGAFMTGFFPIMMFALPAAALAMAQEAKPAARKATFGLMFSVALTAFLTGVTEPLEFAFMFVAWPLYVMHAVLTGTSLAVVNALGIRDGFSFSAGLFDFILNYRIAEQPLLLIVVGLVYAVIYYVLFRFAIRRWNLRTPGREEDGAEGMSMDPTAEPERVERVEAGGRAERRGEPRGQGVEGEGPIRS